jgi:broad specificity phosphatase PhoE
MSWDVLECLAPVLEKELDEAFRALEPEHQPQDLDQVEALIPGFCEKEGAHIYKAATEVLNKIHLGQSALFVSHQPLLGLLRGLLDPLFPPREQTLPKAGIYRFRFDGNNQLLGVDTLLPPK